MSKRVRHENSLDDYSFDRRKRFRYESADQVELLPELLELICRRFWKKTGIQMLEQASFTTSAKERKTNTKLGAKKLRRGFKSLNTFALVSKTWFRAIPWAEFWRELKMVYTKLRSAKCAPASMGPFIRPDYHAIICCMLAVAPARRHFLRFQPPSYTFDKLGGLKDTLLKIQAGDRSNLKWWTFLADTNGRFVFPDELALQFPTPESLTAFEPPKSPLRLAKRYWDYEKRKWKKLTPTTPLAFVKMQEQHWRNHEDALQRFLDIVADSKQGPAIHIPATFSLQLTALIQTLRNVTSALDQDLARRRLLDYDLLRDQLPSLLIDLNLFQIGLEGAEGPPIDLVYL
jgi:hypothetical protein